MKLDLTTTPNFCKYKQITLSTVDNVKKKILLVYARALLIREMDVTSVTAYIGDMKLTMN